MVKAPTIEGAQRNCTRDGVTKDGDGHPFPKNSRYFWSFLIAGKSG
jgi:hypothetical protein